MQHYYMGEDQAPPGRLWKRSTPPGPPRALKGHDDQLVHSPVKPLSRVLMQDTDANNLKWLGLRDEPQKTVE